MITSVSMGYFLRGVDEIPNHRGRDRILTAGRDQPRSIPRMR